MRFPITSGTISATCTTRSGTPNPREQWTYGIDERLFAALRDQGLTRRQRYGLFGHSAGGQFVHRMLSFGFRDRVAVAVSANAGTYAMPDLEVAWPFGLGETELDAETLRPLLEFPITVMTGTHDTKTTGRYLPEGTAFDAPGRARGMIARTTTSVPGTRRRRRWGRAAPGR